MSLSKRKEKISIEENLQKPSQNFEENSIFSKEDDKPFGFINFIDSEDSLTDDEKSSYLQKLGESPKTDMMIRERIKELDDKYSRTSMESSRVLTGKILMEAPEGYFDEYMEQLIPITNAVQRELSSSDKTSQIIRRAQDNPTDVSKQNEAFKLISSYLSTHLGSQTSFKADKRRVMLSMVIDEIIGFSVLGPLWRDKQIDEIVCNGPFDVQVEIKGQITRVPSVKFLNRDHFYRLLERLYRAINKQLAPKTPIVDGRLHDRSRIAAVHHVAAPDGPNFTIRKHKEDYITPETLIEWGTADENLMTFLGNLVHKGGSILIIGSTGTGKTTLLGALSGFIRSNDRIITIEDNIEMKLPKHKLLAAAMESIQAHPDAPSGGITIRQLVKASLRLRPDAIIVGEVRDNAAYDLVQSLNTGHYGMSTLHSNDEADSIFRLASLISQEGNVTQDSALPMIAAAFDVIIRVERYPDGSRKISSVSEISPRVQQKEGQKFLPTRTLWKFEQEETDSETNVKGSWKQYADISSDRQRIRGFRMYHDISWDELKSLTYSEAEKSENLENETD